MGSSGPGRGRVVIEGLEEWTGWDLNPGLPPCEGGDLPLIYRPVGASERPRSDIPFATPCQDVHLSGGRPIAFVVDPHEILQGEQEPSLASHLLLDPIAEP